MKRLLAVTMVFLIIVLSSVSAVGLTVESERNLREIGLAKISENLKEIMKDNLDPIHIGVWLHDYGEADRERRLSAALKEADLDEFVYEEMPNIGCMDREDKEYDRVNQKIDRYISIKRNILKEDITAYNSNVLAIINSKLGKDVEIDYCCSYAPLLLLSADADEIIAISELNEVELIGHNNPEPLDCLSECGDEYSDNIERFDNRDANDYGVWQSITHITNEHQAHNLSGYGVKIGLLQNHVPVFDDPSFSQEDLAALNAQFDYTLTHSLFHDLYSGYYRLSDISHANYMLSILAGKVDNSYYGIAWNAEIYCAGFDCTHNVGYFRSIELMAQNAVNVICASIAMGAVNNEYDFNSMILDWVSSQAEMTVCISTGNNATSGYIHNGAMAYNAIATGNIDDQNTLTLNDDVLRYSSNYSSTITGAYKPDMCAPGARVGTYLSPLDNGGGGGGTSAANAVMAGSCALLMEAYPTLKTKPMQLKSALMVSAINLPNMNDLYSTSSSVDPALLRNYGAGMLDVSEAYTILLLNRYNDIDSIDPEETEFTYSFKVKNSQVNSEKDIYLCINWLQTVYKCIQNNNYYNTSYYTVYVPPHYKLEIYDPNNTLVARSDYSYDRKQFIRYKPLSAGYYTAKITRTITQGVNDYPLCSLAYDIR